MNRRRQTRRGRENLLVAGVVILITAVYLLFHAGDFVTGLAEPTPAAAYPTPTITFAIPDAVKTSPVSSGIPLPEPKETPSK